jgi:hypothetical protein
MPEFLRIGGLKYRKPLERIDERLKRHGSVCSRRSRSGLFKKPQIARIGVEAIGLYPQSEEAVRQTIASLYRFKYQRMPHAGSYAYRLCTNVSMIVLAGNRRNASAVSLMPCRVTVTLKADRRHDGCVQREQHLKNNNQG